MHTPRPLLVQNALKCIQCIPNRNELGKFWILFIYKKCLLNQLHLEVSFICDKHSLCRCNFAVYSPYTCISVKSIHFVHVGVTLQFIVHQIKITLPDTYIYHPNTWSYLINNIQVYMLINTWPQISNLLFQLMMLALKYQSIGTQFWHFTLCAIIIWLNLLSSNHMWIYKLQRKATENKFCS